MKTPKTRKGWGLNEIISPDDEMTCDAPGDEPGAPATLPGTANKKPIESLTKKEGERKRGVEGGLEREGERERDRDRERVCVCVIEREPSKQTS